MRENLKHITINNRAYPLKCDNYVLMQIQEGYGTISRFERDLMGFTEAKDQDGNEILDDNGHTIMIKTEPSMKAINFVLPLMIQEGLDIEAEYMDKEKENLDTRALLRSVDIAFTELADILHEEFKKCFAAKKHFPRKRKRKKVTDR